MRFHSLLLVVAVAFLTGVTCSQLFVRDAHAQASPLASTIYVPSDGIAFRSFGGHVVARLSYDAHGGIFELYDEREQITSRFRGEPSGRNPAFPAATKPLPPPSLPPDVGF
jgi:hypothetical protein